MNALEYVRQLEVNIRRLRLYGLEKLDSGTVDYALHMEDILSYLKAELEHKS